MKKVGFQGVLGAYSESACIHLYGMNAELVPFPLFEDVFEAVQAGEVDAGVLPVENSTTGSIHQNFDNLLNFKLPIVGEVKIQIEHSLLAPKGKTIQDLTGVRSHPQALAQCSRFFEKHPHIKAIPEFDTAGSAKIASEEQGSIGAIASSLAAEVYGLDILRNNLENQSNTNFTRFLAVENQECPCEETEIKTSIVYIPHDNHSGLLYKSLEIFASRNIDLLKIESRPKLGSPWEYVFYLDIRGSHEDPIVQEAILKLADRHTEVHVLGSYAIGKTQTLVQTRNHKI